MAETGAKPRMVADDSPCSGALKSAHISCISFSARPIYSAGIVRLNSYHGSSSTFSACISPCLTARYVACLKSPPSVCLICERPETRVIFISVIGEPVSTPICVFSIRCVSISRCQFLYSLSSGHFDAKTSPLPRLSGSNIKCTSA